MRKLRIDDFGAYFEEVYGRDQRPFPWQAQLLASVVRDGRWPRLLDLPTGTGKTAVIDIALFHLALEAELPSEERRAPLRIVMVVDRRTVVDQAYERAKLIAEKLRGARSGVLGALAERLLLLGDGEKPLEEPLALAQLRGGIPRDDTWAKRPDQPLVAVSTVDQVGSRLLFRGYGLSDSMRPIHAGLLGNDALLLLDEVHLSRPFLEALEGVRRYREWADRPLPSRWQFVAMSATPGLAKEGEQVFGLTAEDRRDERLAKRLRASKRIELTQVKVSGQESVRRRTFAHACAERAAALATEGRAVALIVNRVATAREAFAEVRERLGDRADVYLVTGRMRPLDRDDLDAKLAPRLRSGRARSAEARPAVVISTQCIEAGADYDFDALVTECASLDALRQRFGRLDRLGELGASTGMVLARSDFLAGDADDAVYGRALAETWRWLSEAKPDFGIDAMAKELPQGEALERLLPAPSRAPVMLPAHLDAWAQTAPEPRPSPDVSLWLHGIDQEPARDVQVVWREELTEALLAKAGADRDQELMRRVVERVAACAPLGLEALAVPLHAARAWLKGAAELDVADAQARGEREDDGRERGKTEGRRALLWKGDESEIVDASRLYPGATLVVPSAYGGLEQGAWAPSSKEPVADLGDRARWKQTRRPVLRLLPSTLDPTWPRLPERPSGEDAEVDDEAALGEWLQEVNVAYSQGPAEKQEAWPAPVVRELARQKRSALYFEKIPLGGEGKEDAPEYYAFVGRARSGTGEASMDDQSSSNTGAEVTLSAHLMGAASWARDFARRCGLSEKEARAVELAARLHDVGKVDPRFQRLLHGGSELKALCAAEPLAKSRIVPEERAARVRAQERSGYPKGARHELASVALLQANRWLLGDADGEVLELVLHLVGAHHGGCRPFAPAIADPSPAPLEFTAQGRTARAASNHGLARLDSGVAERFWRLTEIYGWYGLAWMEAIVRLADHRQSEREALLGAGE
jgi:CRISPR-associated endonuclease/helicase Cas3